MPLRPDVTSDAQIRAAAQEIGSLDSLIDNAGVALYDELTDRAALEQSPGRAGRKAACRST
jgi:NADP-dependent 3-hydroxy acid dehydrogenase YdfG